MKVRHVSNKGGILLQEHELPFNAGQYAIDLGFLGRLIFTYSKQFDIPSHLACPHCGGYVRGHQWISADECSINHVFEEPVSIPRPHLRLIP